MPVLIIETGPQKGETIGMEEGKVYTVGRDERADVRLSDELASRVHAKIRGKEGRYFIRDEESSNGTLINDAPVEGTAELKSGDRVTVGATTFSFLADSDAGGAAGRTLGGYKLIQRLGAGGMGTVYRALQLSLNREVALKILSPELSRNPQFVEQFRKEARAAGQLNHPNIVQVYDVDQENKLTFYAMEYMTGGTVEDRINREGQLEVDTAIQLLLEAAKGLQFAEMKQIVHRDIKPDNLMLTEIGTVKIADLGLAHSAQEGDATKGQIIGTPHFISPEQARGQSLDTRSDMYSLGATFFRMLTGKTMFHGERAEEIVRKQVKEAPPSLREARPEVPDAIDSIFTRMVQKDPADRYQSVAELIEEIEKAQSGGGSRLLAATVVVAVVAIGLAVASFLGVFSNDKDNGPREPIIIDKTDPNAEREREKMEAELQKQSREVSAMRSLTDVRDREAELSRADYLEALKQIVAEFPGTKTAIDLGPTISGIEREIEAAAQREAAIAGKVQSACDALNAQVSAAVAAGDFVEAARRVAARGDIEPDLAEREAIANAAAAAMSKVADAAGSAVDDALAASRQALDAADFSLAAAEAKRAIDAVAGADDLADDGSTLRATLVELGAGARELLAEVNQREATHRNQQLAGDLRAIMGEFDWPKYYSALRRYRFAEALASMRALRDRLATDEYRAYLDPTLAELGRAADHFDAFVAAIRQGTLTDRRIRHPDRGVSGEIQGLSDDGDGIVVEIVRSIGSTRTIFTFDEFSSPQACLDLLAGRADSDDHALDGVLCARFVLRAAWAAAASDVAGLIASYKPDDGWTATLRASMSNITIPTLRCEQLTAILDAARANPATAARAQEIGARIDRENEALGVLDRALRPFRPDSDTHFAESVDLFGRFVESYRDTGLFLATYRLFDSGEPDTPLVGGQS